MSRIIFMNDRLVPEEEARVSVFDHGLLYGDGVFEGLRSYSGRVFRLAEHIDRLYASGLAICLQIPRIMLTSPAFNCIRVKKRRILFIQ